MLNRVLQFSLMLVFVLPSFSHFSNQMETLHSESEISKTGTGSIEGDAWLSIDLVSWQVNSSVIWDADDTLFDPQFYVCLDVDGDTDGISPECVWTEIWYDTIELENSWNVTFDLPESFEFINITIECWDNDDSSDEWNDGNDACDLNADDDYWRMYYQTNFSDFTSENVTGSGYGDQNSQGSKGDASSIWKFSLIIYPDSDSDGVADQFDDCNQTPEGREVSTDGCWWMEGDIDDDGIINPQDYCNGMFGDCKLGPQYVYAESIDNIPHFHPNGSLIRSLSMSSNSVFGYGPDGSYLYQIGKYDCRITVTEVNDSGFGEWFSVSPGNGNACSVHDAIFAQEKLYLLIGNQLVYYEHQEIKDLIEGTTSYVHWSVLQTFDGLSSSCCQVELNVNPSETYVLGRMRGEYNSFLIDVSTNSISSLDIVIQNWADRHGFISDRHFFDGDYYFDILTGATYNSDYPSQPYHVGNYPILSYSQGDGRIALVNPVDSSSSSSLIGCQGTSCGNNGWRFVVSPDGSMIIKSDTGNGFGAHTLLHVDNDIDGVPDITDLCSNTEFGQQVNAIGCAENQKDDDSDGVLNSADMCPNTSANLQIDETGCAQYQLDDDIDGVANDIDVCPNSPGGETVDLSGCSSSQIDIDEDGVYDSQDNCPSTPSETTVDSTGCAPDDVVDLDSDVDGVRDSTDVCPNSATGIIVDQSGCEIEKQTDEESDATNGLSNQEIMICGGGGLLIFGFLVALFSTYTGDDNDNDDAWMYETIGGIGLTAESSEETDLELENVVAELERQRAQSEREINQLRQQQAQQSNASEIEAMQREMQALQQRVADSEQAKIQLKNEIEQVKIQHDESINMQDSVVGGDVVASGGQKIESQTNVTGADPEAIARIIFEAQEKERERLRKERNE